MEILLRLNFQFHSSFYVELYCKLHFKRETCDAEFSSCQTWTYFEIVKLWCAKKRLKFLIIIGVFELCNLANYIIGFTPNSIKQPSAKSAKNYHRITWWFENYFMKYSSSCLKQFHQRYGYRCHAPGIRIHEWRENDNTWKTAQFIED